MQVVHETAELVGTAKSGVKKYWVGRVLEDNGLVYTQGVWWQVKADGHASAVQESTPALVEGKNLGKKNQTDPLTQAYSELNAEVKKLRDKKGYRYIGEAVADTIPLPMLAKKFLEQVDDVDWTTACVSPKLDGHRALYDGTRFTTRGGQLHAPHVQKALAFDTQGLIMDGELMLDPNCPSCKGLSKVERFQLSGSAIKKDHPELTPWLRYNVYDCVSSQPFSKRYAEFQQVLACLDPELPVCPVQAIDVADEAAVISWLDTYCSQGYEGVMVRDDSAGYELGHRSNSLLKLKPYDDAEFKILDVVPAGKGKAADVGKFVCVTADGVEFRANPRGSVATRRKYLECRAALVGQWITVHFEGYSKDGKPRFPRAIALREDWDK